MMPLKAIICIIAILAVSICSFTPAFAQVGTFPEAEGVEASQGVATGIASKYWIELKVYPLVTGLSKRLNLYVNSRWVILKNPGEVILEQVIAAFNNPTLFETLVMYEDTTNLIIGLVVRTK